jgi:hypothetical protein
LHAGTRGRLVGAELAVFGIPPFRRSATRIGGEGEVGDEGRSEDQCKIVFHVGLSDAMEL